MGLTTTSYESQLNLMSEHVATMNDKLATQTDQVLLPKNAFFFACLVPSKMFESAARAVSGFPF